LPKLGEPSANPCGVEVFCHAQVAAQTPLGQLSGVHGLLRRLRDRRAGQQTIARLVLRSPAACDHQVGLREQRRKLEPERLPHHAPVSHVEWLRLHDDNSNGRKRVRERLRQSRADAKHIATADEDQCPLERVFWRQPRALCANPRKLWASRKVARPERHLLRSVPRLGGADPRIDH